MSNKPTNTTSRWRPWRGRNLRGIQGVGGTESLRRYGAGAALYFDTPPAYVGDRRPVRISHLDGTQTALTVDEARTWLAECSAWLDERYPELRSCPTCDGSGALVEATDAE